MIIKNILIKIIFEKERKFGTSGNSGNINFEGRAQLERGAKMEGNEWSFQFSPV